MAKRKSEIITHVAGTASLLGVGVLCVVGSHAYVGASQRSMNQQIVRTQQEINVARTKAALAAAEATDASPKDTEPVLDDEGYVIPVDKTDAQRKWAEDHGVHWDEQGNPVDTDGYVIDDPITEENEIDLARKNGTLTEDGHSGKAQKKDAKSKDSSQKDAEKQHDKEDSDNDTSSGDVRPVTSRISYDEYSEDRYMDAWFSHDYIDKSADGYYYIVHGDITLKDISEDVGYTVDELSEWNNIADPDDLRGISRVYFPNHAPMQNHDLSGEGRG